VFIQIDNGYQNRLAPHTSGRVFESLGPLTGALAVFGARDSHWSQIAHAQFDHSFTFALQGHPGIQAALGWSLSSSATDDLTRQLQVDANHHELNKLYNLLRPRTLTCPTAT
jgi:hypothetical protein